MNKNIYIGIVVAIVVAAVAGYFLLFQAPGEEKVFYVIAYHWGFAFFDEDLNEISRIEVSRGDKVKIYLFPSTAFSEEFAKALEQRSLQRGVGQYQPGDPDILNQIAESKSIGLLDHGILIQGYDVQLATKHNLFSGTANSLAEFLEKEDKSAIEDHSVTFVADKSGSFTILCLVVCSYGHPYMIAENGLVVRG